MAEHRATLQKVAEHAGVSLKTASRVLNGEPYVAASTAARVRAAVRELGYRPDQSARNLAKGSRFRMAGLLITTLANPQVVALARGVEQVLREEGYSLVIASTEDDPESERILLEEFWNRGVESLVVVPSGVAHQHLSEAADRMSIVLAHRLVDGVLADSVAPDDFAATKKAVVALLREGHHRIAFVGDHGHISNIRQRYEGFRAAHEQAGIPVIDDLVSLGHRTADSSAACVSRFLKSHEAPSAVFASNNLNCLGTLQAVRKEGVGVSVVGFDELAEAEYLGVPVTLLCYDQAELGRTAARLLVARVNGEHSTPQRLTLPVIPRRVGQRDDSDSRILPQGVAGQETHS